MANCGRQDWGAGVFDLDCSVPREKGGEEKMDEPTDARTTRETSPSLCVHTHTYLLYSLRSLAYNYELIVERQNSLKNKIIHTDS